MMRPRLGQIVLNQVGSAQRLVIAQQRCLLGILGLQPSVRMRREVPQVMVRVEVGNDVRRWLGRVSRQR